MTAANKPKLIIATQEQSCKLPNLYIIQKEVKIPDLKKVKTLDFIKQNNVAKQTHLWAAICPWTICFWSRKTCFVNEVFPPNLEIIMFKLASNFWKPAEMAQYLGTQR